MRRSELVGKTLAQSLKEVANSLLQRIHVPVPVSRSNELYKTTDAIPAVRVLQSLTDLGE